MTYSISGSYNATTQVFSGMLSSTIGPVPPAIASVEPPDRVVITAYADDASSTAAYVAQARSSGDGSFAMNLSALAAGNHAIALTADYGVPIATVTITAPGPGATPSPGRRDRLVDNTARP